MITQCIITHVHDAYKSRGEPNSAPCSLLPWSKLMSNRGAMPRLHQPSGSFAHKWRMYRKDRGILGVCECLLRHRTTGHHQQQGPISEHSPLPLRWLLAVGSGGSDESLLYLSSRHPFIHIPHLSWSGTSELNERGFLSVDLYCSVMAFKSLLLITYSFPLFPRHKKLFLSTFPKA